MNTARHLFKRIDHKFLVIFFICSSILWIGTYAQRARNYRTVSTERFYYGGEENSLDLSQNIALVRLGYEGHPAAYYNNTSVFPPKPSLLKMEYILIGKIGRIVGLEPFSAYSVLRAGIAFCYFVLIAFLIGRLLPTTSARVLAAIFILFGTAVTLRNFDQQEFVWASVFDTQVLFRLTYAMPHYLLGGIFCLISLVSYIRTVTHSTKTTLFFIISLISGVLGSFVYGPAMLLGLASAAVGTGLFLFQQTRDTERKIDIIQICRIAGVTFFVWALPLLYARFVVAYEWASFNLSDYVEKLNPFHLTFATYLLAVGPTYIIAFFSLRYIVRRRWIPGFFFYPWLFLHPLLVFFLAPRLDLNEVRFFLTPYFVVFGVLSAVSVMDITDLKRRGWRSWIVMGLAAGIVLVPSIGTFRSSWKRFELCFCFPPFYTWGYPTKNFVSSTGWLDAHSQDSDIVLSSTYAGTLIPTFAGNYVYTSWWFRLTNVPAYWETQGNVNRFYLYQMSTEEARQFVITKKIRYVFDGGEEKAIRGNADTLSYPFLKERFTDGDITIYEVSSNS